MLSQIQILTKNLLHHNVFVFQQKVLDSIDNNVKMSKVLLTSQLFGEGITRYAKHGAVILSYSDVSINMVWMSFVIGVRRCLYLFSLYRCFKFFYGHYNTYSCKTIS